MEPAKEILPIYQCPDGVPEKYLLNPLPLKIEKIKYGETVAKVTLVYHGSDQHEINAFQIPGREGKVVLFRNDPDAYWDYESRRGFEIYCDIKRIVHVEFEKGFRPWLLTYTQIQEDHNWINQQAPNRFCVLI